jgi:hypothetical protein
MEVIQCVRFEFGHEPSYWHKSSTSTVLKNGFYTQYPSVLGVQKN